MANVPFTTDIQEKHTYHQQQNCQRLFKKKTENFLICSLFKIWIYEKEYVVSMIRVDCYFKVNEEYEY